MTTILKIIYSVIEVLVSAGLIEEYLQQWTTP
jgi:hypothetical protein